MRASARTLAIEDQVLAVLRDEYPLPIGTMAVCDKIGVSRWDERGRLVYTVLRRLAQRGRVERFRPEGYLQVYWRLT